MQHFDIDYVDNIALDGGPYYWRFTKKSPSMSGRQDHGPLHSISEASALSPILSTPLTTTVCNSMGDRQHSRRTALDPAVSAPPLGKIYLGNGVV